jgi:hypothetical protein
LPETYLFDTINKTVSGGAKMNRWRLLVPVALLGFISAPALSDVYIWTDENGVKHYSNVAPTEEADEIDKSREIRTSKPPGNETPARRERRARKSSAPSQSTAQPQPQPSEKTGEAPDNPKENHSAQRLDLKQFPVPQDQLVAREKTFISKLKQDLEASDADREAIIRSEKKRLMQAITDLEEASLSKFGSQKNKRRQVGYYKYRLEALMNSPETYFEYGESETD